MKEKKKAREWNVEEATVECVTCDQDLEWWWQQRGSCNLYSLRLSRRNDLWETNYAIKAKKKKKKKNPKDKLCVSFFFANFLQMIDRAKHYQSFFFHN